MFNNIKGEVTVRTFDTIDIKNCIPNNKYQVEETKTSNAIDSTWITSIMSALSNLGVTWNHEVASPAFGAYNSTIHPIQRVCGNLDPEASFAHEFSQATLIYVMIGLENNANEKALGLSIAAATGTVHETTKYKMTLTNYFYGLTSPAFTSAELGTIKLWTNDAGSGDGSWTWWLKMASATGISVNPAIYQSSSVEWSIILS